MRARAGACSRPRMPPAPAPSSIELPQIHPGVERGDLRISIEQERLAARELADAPLLRLRPARVVHLRIHVGVEAVLDAAAVLVPGGGRLSLLQPDAYDALGGLETVLPGHHEADGGAVRIRQRLAVK